MPIQGVEIANARPNRSCIAHLAPSRPAPASRKHMARSLAQIQSQIDKLQREAEALRAKEISGVVARIKEAISHYGLTPQELFGEVAAKKPRGKAAAKADGKSAKKPAAKKPAAPPKFRDEAGNTWTGHGKRPNWFKAALAAGKTAADLEIKN